MHADRKAVWGWALYDWANSAFATTVMAGFFPVFFKQYWSHGADVNLSTAQLALGNSLAGIAMALLAPVLGAVADRSAATKRLLLLFAYLGVLATAALYWVDRGCWQWAIVLYALGVVGFSGANVFYDALLPSVAPAGAPGHRLEPGLRARLPRRRAALPGQRRHGHPPRVVRHRGQRGRGAPVLRLGGGLVGRLQPVHARLGAGARRPGRGARGCSAPLADGLRELRGTFARLRSYRPAFVFLAAYWCYIDGVDTIIRMAVDYGLSLGFPASDLIAALLIVQFVGFPAAIAFGRMGQRLGPRRVDLTSGSRSTWG